MEHLLGKMTTCQKRILLEAHRGTPVYTVEPSKTESSGWTEENLAQRKKGEVGRSPLHEREKFFPLRLMK